MRAKGFTIYYTIQKINSTQCRKTFRIDSSLTDYECTYADIYIVC